MEPTLSQVIEVVRNSSGEHRKPIDSNTLIEADLHICGIDGEELLEDCEEAFGVQLATEEDGYMKTFALAENEYLFTDEGIDFFWHLSVYTLGTWHTRTCDTRFNRR